MNTPVLGSYRRVASIIHQVEDVTEFVQLRTQGSQAARRSAELEERTEQMQAEILRRSQDLQEANRALRAADEAKTSSCRGSATSYGHRRTRSSGSANCSAWASSPPNIWAGPR